MTSFVERVHGQRSKDGRLYLVHGIDRGKKAWYYVMVDRLKEHRLKSFPRGERIPLDQLGTIVASGWGEQPPEDISKRYGAS